MDLANLKDREIEHLTSYNPISRITLPGPQSALGWDGNEVPVAPESIRVICIGIDGAFEFSSDLLDAVVGFGGRHCGWLI